MRICRLTFNLDSRASSPRRFRLLLAPAKTAATAIVLLLLAAPSLHADQVYKSIDAQGHVVYSDRGTSSTSQKSEVHVDQPNTADAARSLQEQQILKTEEMQRKHQEASDEKRKAQAEDEKKIRCERARDRYNTFKDVGRIYKMDSNGNRVFYSDTEADAMRAQARQAMTTACGT